MEKLSIILKELEQGKISSDHAEQQVLDLFAVSGRSEQLPCDYCEETKPLKYCQDCWEKLEQFKQCY
jgi:hypothetical protein